MSIALYFHGGPGLNANPERNLWVDQMSGLGIELKLWEEPSFLRGTATQFTGAYTYDLFLNDAERFFLENFKGTPIFLIAHSFGAHVACELAKLHPEKIAKIFFISTDFSLEHADLNMFNLTRLDFAAHGDLVRAEALEKVIQNYSGAFDSNTQQGFGLISENPRFLEYYWFNKTVMPRFLAYYGEAGYGIDVTAFMSVRATWHEANLKGCSVPAVAIFGKHDIVISDEIEQSILESRFLKVHTHRFEFSAHYPHIEEIENFLELIQNEIKNTFILPSMNKETTLS